MCELLSLPRCSQTHVERCQLVLTINVTFITSCTQKLVDNAWTEVESNSVLTLNILPIFKEEKGNLNSVLVQQILTTIMTFSLSIRIQTTLNHIRFVFYHNINDNERNLCAKICWRLKTPTPTWKCTRCIMQMSYLYTSDFPFKNFCKLAQHAEAIRENCLGKE